MTIYAGQRIRALDFAGYASVYDFANDELTGLTAGTWIPTPTTVGVAFVAPTSGAVKCDFGGRIRQYMSGSLRVAAACELRTGNVIGSGVVVEAPDADRAIEIGISPTTSTSQLEASSFRIHTGLTPGSLYHFRFMIQTADAGNAGVYARYIAVMPWHG